MSHSGAKHLHKELKNWRQNKTESWRLSETHDQFDKELASRRRAHAREVQLLSRELGVKVTKTTPSVEEHLGKSKRRNDNLRAADRARSDRRYKNICKANVRNFQQLKLPSPANMPPEMYERLVAKRGSTSDSASKRPVVQHKAEKDETSDENRRKEEENDNAARGSDNDTEGSSGEDEVAEPPDWYMGRRRFTLATLNDLPDHQGQERRYSSGALNLAAVLEVSLARNRSSSKLAEELADVNEESKSTDSEHEESTDACNNFT